jgi:hypothetical protein
LTRLYVDLDGVLADFDKQYDLIFGMESRNDKKQFWKNVDAAEEWFFHLPPMEDAQELFDYVSKHTFGFKILTATGYNYEKHSAQKRAWCKKHFNIEPENVITVVSGATKAQYAESRYDILIDDRLKAIDPWRLAGGTGILHTDAKTTIQQLKEFS